MPIIPTVFSQLQEILPVYEFRKCVSRYKGNYKVRSFSCLDQYLCMVFAQLTYRESLRDIETCLRSMQPKLYHMGIRGRVSRSTLAEANENRDWRIFADFAQVLISMARPLYAGEPLGVELDQTLYALDATIIDLCLSLFPWASFRRSKGAIKLHTVMDLRGNIPVFIRISVGRIHDVNLLDDLIVEPGAIYVMDRGYLDFARLFSFHQQHAVFVIRARKDIHCRRVYSHPVDKSTGIQCDQTVVLNSFYPSHAYPDKLRRIRYFDVQRNKRLVFLTNHFSFPARTIANIYQARWQIELFFKWIKQHLRIKAFFGTSENAVKSQIWIAISVYVLVAILKKRLQLEQSLYTILQILSVAIFEKRPILQVFSEIPYTSLEDLDRYQLKLFDL